MGKDAEKATEGNPQENVKQPPLKFDDIQYVYEMMGVKVPLEAHAPSKGAYAWLQACQKSDSVKNDFYRSIWRPRIEADRKKNVNLEDDGRPALERVRTLLLQMEQRKGK